MLNDPRVRLLPTRGETQLDVASLRDQAVRLLEAGYDADAQRTVDLLLALGDASPSVLLVAAALADTRGDSAKAEELLRLCLPQVEERDPTLARMLAARLSQ